MIHAFYLNHQCTDDNLKLSNLLLSQTQFKIVSSRANAENFCRFGRIHTCTQRHSHTVLTRLNPDFQLCSYVQVAGGISMPMGYRRTIADRRHTETDT